MIYVVVAIKDRCANVYAQPFCSPTLETAIRAFRMLVNDSHGGLPNTNPDDFDLFHLCTYNDETGLFSEPAGPPVQIAMGRQMVAPLASG